MSAAAWIAFAAFMFATASAIFGYGFWLGRLEKRVADLEHRK